MNAAEKIKEVTGAGIPEWEAEMVMAAAQAWSNDDVSPSDLLRVLCELLATTMASMGEAGFVAKTPIFEIDFTYLPLYGGDDAEGEG